MQQQSQIQGACPCDETRFTILGEPLFRGFCHCTICQEFNQAPFADITLFRGKDVDLHAESMVKFNTSRKPPNARRGKCRSCELPAIEYIDLPAMNPIVIIPTANLRETMALPDPWAHIFYHRSLQDADDNLPKYSGYWNSQLRFQGHLTASMMRS